MANSKKKYYVPDFRCAVSYLNEYENRLTSKWVNITGKDDGFQKFRWIDSFDESKFSENQRQDL